MKVSNNFIIQEFVPPSIYNEWFEKSIWFIRPVVISFAQFIRDRYGKSVTINNWHAQGKFAERGFRMPTSSTGGKLSQHRFGNAIDFNVAGMTADEVRADILAHESEFMAAGLTTIEDGAYAPTWVHADFRTTGLPGILIVKP